MFYVAWSYVELKRLCSLPGTLVHCTNCTNSKYPRITALATYLLQIFFNLISMVLN